MVILFLATILLETMQNKTRLIAPALLFLGFLALSACKTGASKQTGAYNYLSLTSTPEEIEANTNKMDKVFQMLIGQFNNKEQADTSSTGIFQEQDMIAVPMWRHRKGEYWLYMGWFKTGVPDRPLAQGIFQLTKIDRDTFKLKFHLPPHEADNDYYSGEWRKEQPFANLGPRDLLHDPGCVNYIVERGNNTFEVISAGLKCKRYISDLIRYFDFQAMLSPQGQSHFTVFYNEQEEEVFSYPRPNGAIYKRVDKNNPPYLEKKKG